MIAAATEKRKRGRPPGKPAVKHEGVGRPMLYDPELEPKKEGRGRTPKAGTPPKRVNINLRKIPSKLRDDFKAFCAVRGVPMNKVIIEYMRDCVRNANQNRLRL